MYCKIIIRKTGLCSFVKRGALKETVNGEVLEESLPRLQEAASQEKVILSPGKGVGWLVGNNTISSLAALSLSDN